MTSPFNSRRALSILVGGLALAALAGLAPTPVTVKDRFNNNSIGNLWLTRVFGGISVNETNQRLEFSASGSTGQVSITVLEIKNWGANWRKDFEVETRFRMNVNNVNGDREVQLGILLRIAGDLPNHFTGYIATILRTNGGRTLLLARINNDNEAEVDAIPLGSIQGKLTVEYDRSDDRLEARVGNRRVHLDGVWSRFGASHGSDPMIIGIGCATADGNISFPGTRAYLDSFEFQGVKRAR